MKSMRTVADSPCAQMTISVLVASMIAIDTREAAACSPATAKAKLSHKHIKNGGKFRFMPFA